LVKTSTAMKTAYSGNNSNINKYRSLNDVCHSLIGFVNNQNHIATLQSQKSQTINLTRKFI